MGLTKIASPAPVGFQKGIVRAPFLSLVLSILFFPLAVQAFSLGEIRIKGGAENQFIAEIPLTAEGDVRVGIGDANDYNRLQVERPDFLDNLTVEVVPDPSNEVKKQIFVVSREPILSPSFNLLIRASMGSGTILKNYFIALDYSRSLSLDLPEAETAPRTYEEETDKPINVLLAEKKEMGPEPTPAADSTPQKEPAKTLDEVQENTYTVKRGDTLSKIAESLPLKGLERDRVVVALWRANPGAFIQGNIHGLRVGSRLNLQGLEVTATQVKVEEARGTIRSQWEQWTGSSEKPVTAPEETKTPSPEPEPPPTQVAALPLPLEPQSVVPDVKDRVHQWKHHRDEKNLDGLMELYKEDFQSDTKNLADWKADIQNEWSQQGPEDKVQYEETRFRQAPGGVEVTLQEETDREGKPASQVRSLHFAPDEAEWKIEEEYVEEGPQNTGLSHPYVVHVASVKGWEPAANMVNDLRQAGFNAFQVSVNLPEKGVWQRILIDRFPTENEANRFADRIKKNGVSDFAGVLKLPFAVQLAKSATKDQAIETVKKAKEARISTYLMLFEEEGEIRFQILAGAYGSAEEAGETQGLLGKTDLAAEIVQP
jgi:cell division septation protein DedD